MSVRGMAQRALRVVREHDDVALLHELRETCPSSAPRARAIARRPDESAVGCERAREVCARSVATASARARSARRAARAVSRATCRARRRRRCRPAPSARRAPPCSARRCAAPPARCSAERVRTTGTGASGEIRAVSPNQYSSSIASPATSTRTREKSGIVKSRRRVAPGRAERHSTQLRSVRRRAAKKRARPVSFGADQRRTNDA